MPAQNRTFSRRWAGSIALLTGGSLFVFWGLYSLDHVLHGDPRLNPFERFVRFDPSSITDAVSSLAGMIAAVFGIVITVVSIIVQLSAARYAGVARMFVRDRVNLSVMSFYVVTCVCGVWLSVSLQTDYVPRLALMAMVAATTAGLVLMGPYFGYVFWFLEPNNIISRIQHHLAEAASAGARDEETEGCDRAQVAALSAMEELTDITSNAISGKDKIIASSAVDALKDFALDYVAHKNAASERWFRIGSGIAGNPDFVAMDPESLSDLETRRTWVEWKVMRQYLGIYGEALASMRDINYLIAIDTRYLGEAATRTGDATLMKLVYRFMNSYLRATLNARDVRTAYNVLNQYRLLVESALKAGQGALALEGTRHMSYYGHVGFDMKLTFVTETVAYDISTICQTASEVRLGEEEALLDLFLELDRPLRSRSQEMALLGVRKAQVKLAAFYLMQGDEEKARRISRDMEAEPAERLAAIRRSLEAVTSKDFWEIIDRGRNFEYMPDAQRACLSRFFDWLGMDRGPSEAAGKL